MAPSLTRSCPLMKVDSSLARNTAACAMSSGRPARGIGWALLDLAHHVGGFLGRFHRQSQCLAENAGGDRARRNAVDANARFAELHRHALRQMNDGGLGRAVND